MLFIQLTGLSGSGKSTIALGVKEKFIQYSVNVEIIDADIFRPILCKELGFSKADRCENIRRLGFVANLLTINGVIVILAAINPYEKIRAELRAYGPYVKTVWINCNLETLIKRDPKNLYKKAMLPAGHVDKINNLSGVNDPYDIPQKTDLIINTHDESEETSINKLFNYITKQLTTQPVKKYESVFPPDPM